MCFFKNLCLFVFMHVLFLCMSITNYVVKLGGGVLWTNSNPKSLNLAKFSFERNTLDQVKPEASSISHITVLYQLYS